MLLLFPNTRLSPANPLYPNLKRLPQTLKGGGSLADWEVTSAGGRETITTVLMRHPNMEVERRLQELPPARADQHVQYAEVNPVSFLRGIGGIAEEPSFEAAHPPSHVSEALKAIIGSHAGPEAPWTWQMELEKPKGPQ